jgi:hypothetical protein
MRPSTEIPRGPASGPSRQGDGVFTPPDLFDLQKKKVAPQGRDQSDREEDMQQMHPAHPA